ncbi:MAG: glycosyltransferase [Saprospiraceae bacterium]
MAKIICVTTGLRGILNASFELVDRLQNDGHEVIYASPGKVAVSISGQGLRFVQLPAIENSFKEEIPNYNGPLKKLSRFFYKYKNAEERKSKALNQWMPRAFAGLLESERPDLVLIDIELHEYIFTAYGQKIPFLLLSQWFSLWNRPGLPYLLTDTIPGEGVKGNALAIRLHWNYIKVKRWWIFQKKKINSLSTDRRSVLLEIAKQEKFPLRYLKENYWPGPFTYGELPVLSMTAKEMEFPHEERPNHTYIGPMVAVNRVETTLEEEEAERLEAAFDYRQKNKAALIYCSVSTLSEGDFRFIQKVIEAVELQEDWLLIIGMGKLIEDVELKTLSKNIFPFRFVPQLKVLERAALSINHGGIHTINECIHFKIPMLVYSGKKSDQNGCAARVAYHQLGMMADKDKDSAIDITIKIEEVLTNEDFRVNINEMHTHYLKYKEESFAEQIINGFLPKNSKGKAGRS